MLVIWSQRIYSEIFISRAIAKSQVRLAIVHCVHTHWIGYYWMCKKANVDPYGMLHTESRQPVLKVHRISNRQHIQRCTKDLALCWKSMKKQQCTAVMYLCIFMSLCYRIKSQSSQDCGGPQSAQRRATGCYVPFFVLFFWKGVGRRRGGGVATINPYNLEYFSVTHTPYALPTPPPLPVLRTAMAASNERT